MVETPYNVSAATRVLVTGVAFGLVCFAACRWRPRLGFVFGVLAIVWAGLFPFYWADWFNTPRAAREYGDWRLCFGIGAALLPLLLVGAGSFRRCNRAPRGRRLLQARNWAVRQLQ